MPERYWLTFTTRHRHGRPTQEPVYYQREGDRWRLYFGKSGRRRAVGTESDAAVRWQVDLAKSEGRFVRHEPDQGRMFNPLVRGYSRGAIAANIRREIHAGRDQDQAVAIALATARRAYRSRHPRGRLPAQLRRNPPMHNPLYGAEAAKVMRRMDQAQRELDLASREARGSDDPEVRHYARKRRDRLIRELARLSRRLHWENPARRRNPAEIAKLQAAMLREEARYDRTADLYRYDDRTSARVRVMKAAGQRDRAQKAVYDAMRRGANPRPTRGPLDRLEAYSVRSMRRAARGISEVPERHRGISMRALARRRRRRNPNRGEWIDLLVPLAFLVLLIRGRTIQVGA